MQQDKFKPFSPVQYTDRVRIISWLNFVFSAYYLFRFYRIHVGIQIYQTDGTPTLLQYLVAFVLWISLLVSGYLLLRSKRLGKTIVRFSGILCGATILMYFVWGFTFLWREPYDLYPLIVVGNAFALLVEYALRYSYPILAGYVALNLPDDLLGLK